MIKQLTSQERETIEQISDNTPNAIRIKALLKAYGMGLPFISFFADETGDIVICLQDNTATLYLKDKTKASEAAEFLALTSNSILSEEPLELDSYHEEKGNTYACDKIVPTFLDDISYGVQAGYNVLYQVFDHSINSTTYPRWYTEVSHRIRHGMSKMYTYRGICSATAYCNVDGQLLMAQIGTLKQARGQGHAYKLIHHVATDQQKVKQIVVLSQDKISDQFYEKIGFQLVRHWYYYTKH